ncbi:MAG: YggS family pyridoxal phosphate-dependent enzyme [Candidatus Eremiobacteraeota bacterium]|nr:YggS family pyridoxal phosphate-dependent enzyme [Candidatus Eremiobacteraeota bacterium]
MSASNANEEPARRIAAAVLAVRSRIARACGLTGRPPQDVTVVAVSKGFGPEVIEAAIAAGLTDIGENYSQEAKAKFSAVAWPTHPIRRHFIGRLQRNKIGRVAALFDVVQTIDDIAAAEALAGAAASAGKPHLDVLVQLNVASDERAGVPPHRCLEFAEQLGRLRGLRLRGLMAVGPRDPASVHDAFAVAAKTYNTMRAGLPHIEWFSLGMSGDLPQAIAAGSTMLRLGAALFGERPKKEGVML